MKTQRQSRLFYLALFLSFLTGISSYAKSQASFWEKQPESLHDRYLKASAYFHEDWVPAFADSLEMMVKSTGKKEFLFFAEELRCHHAFHYNDSLEFIRHSELARSLAIKYKFENEYFSEMVNLSSFFMNMHDKASAEDAANVLLDEARRLKSRTGLFYGYYLMGTMYAQAGNWTRSIENYLKAAEFTQPDEDGHNGTLGQIYGLVAFDYLEMEDYDNAVLYGTRSLAASSYEDDSNAALAMGYYGQGEYGKFREYAQKYISLESSPSVSYDYYNGFLSILLYGLDNRFDEAMELLEEYRDTEDYNELHAELSRMMGDWKTAYEYQQKVNMERRANNREIFNEEVSRLGDELSKISSISQRARASYTRVVILIVLVCLVIIFAFNAWKNRKILRMQKHELDITRQYHILVENAPFGYSKAKLIYGDDGTVRDYRTIEVNRIIKDATESAGATIGDKTIMEAYPDSGHVLIEKINDALNSGMPYVRFSYHLSEFDRYYETFILVDGSDTIQVLSLNTSDLVHARKDLEVANGELTEAKEKAEKSDSIKTQFIQNMSHEIRTPLNAIVGFSQLLGLPDGFNTDQEKSMYSSYIKNNSDMLMMLIDDILDIADAENGNYRIVLDEASCNQICQNAIKTVEYRTPPGVRMYYTSEVEDEFTIMTDARRIQQVMINYLTNACKHTQEGEIHVHCSISENPGKITFSVTDTGIGVPPEMAENIFERFTKLDAFKQGAGLGLNICSTIAGKLGGKVLLDTSYTDGARFLFII